MIDKGPLDKLRVPEQLTARVVEPDTLAVRGYACEQDLARYYGFPDTAYLALTGELPGEAVSRALDAALTFLAPVTVAEAPGHAAVLARVCAADTAATISIAATTLAEQAHHLLDSLAPWIGWLAEPAGPRPDGFGPVDGRDADSSRRLAEIVADAGLDVPALREPTSRSAAIAAVLHACGLRSREQMAVMIVTARLPCVMAEALNVPLASFQSYPMHLPPYHVERP